MIVQSWKSDKYANKPHKYGTVKSPYTHFSWPSVWVVFIQKIEAKLIFFSRNVFRILAIYTVLRIIVLLNV